MEILKDFIAATDNAEIDMVSVMVQRKDESHLYRYRETEPLNIYSASKSFVSLALGMAIDEGIFNFDSKVIYYLGKYMDEETDLKWKDVTLYHLMTMNTGFDVHLLKEAERIHLKGLGDPVPERILNEWLYYLFPRPLAYYPGEHFGYGNQVTYIACRMLEEAVGCSVNEFLTPRLWEPLGMEQPYWEEDPSGHTFGATGLYLDVTDMVKLGSIFLNGGELDGHRYVSSDFVKKATTKQVTSTPIIHTGIADDEEAGYGLYFWMNKNAPGYRAYGRDSQFIIIIPEYNCVIATQSTHKNSQETLDLVWKHILPKLA